MKIYPSFRLQLRDHAPAVIVYYAVLVSMVIISLIIMPFVTNPDDSGYVATNGVTAVTMIFSCIVSLCAFKDVFFLSLQYGVSRRTQFLARLMTMGTICAVLAVADELYTLLLQGLDHIFPNVFSGGSLYWMIYSSDGTSPKGPFFDIVFSFFALLAVCSFGYLLTVLNYRLNKLGKLLFWAGTPITVGLIVSYVSEHPAIAGRVVPFLMSLLGAGFSSLPRMLVTCTVLTAVFSGLTWLLMRRAAVK